MNRSRPKYKEMYEKAVYELGRNKESNEKLRAYIKGMEAHIKKLEEGAAQTAALLDSILGALAVSVGKAQEDGTFALNIPMDEIMNAFKLKVTADRIDGSYRILVARKEEKKEGE